MDNLYIVVTAHAGIINDCEVMDELDHACAYANLLSQSGNAFSNPETDDVKVFNRAGELVYTPEIGVWSHAEKD